MKKQPPNIREELRTALAMQERSPQWLAFTSRVALFAGALSVVAAIAMPMLEDLPVPNLTIFACLWGCVFAASAVFATAWFKRGSQSGDADGIELVTRTFIPFWIVAAFISVLIVGNGSDTDTLSLAVVWCLFHGLGLVSQRLVLPRRLVLLGWSFLLAGCVAMTLPLPTSLLAFVLEEPLASSVVMGSTFGLFHLVYAALGWSSAVRRSSPRKT